MGSFASCWLDNFEVLTTKNSVSSDLITLFRSENKIITSTIPIYFPCDRKYYQEIVNENNDIKLIYYEAPINTIRDRLNILGYDLRNAYDGFSKWISETKHHAERRIGELERNDFLFECYANEIEVLSELTPEIWIEKLWLIRESDLKPREYKSATERHVDKTIDYMLTKEWYGYPGYDLFIPIRLATEMLDARSKLFYDITQLVWSGYYDYNDDVIQSEIDFISLDFNSKFKTIILTEGKSDAWILRETMNILYPHLKDFYSFLDFESTGFGGGVGNLANVVKAFAGAGIGNNVIALFDNDTAALSACRNFEKIDLPSNIVICHLPEINLLKEYPTIGPSGLINLDVNGIAASIELYLGEDILRIDGTNFSPIQWTGFDKFASQYQGEVIDKPQLHKRFRDKLNCTQNDEQGNWDDLKQIFDLLFGAFSEKNRSIICNRASAYYYN